MIQEISTIQDVVTFIEQIAQEMPNHNPFEFFKNYRAGNQQQPKYTPQEVRHREYLLDKCFIVCANQSGDFINLSLVIFEEARTKIAIREAGMYYP